MMKFAKGFTLIELMVAVAIIAILGAVTVVGYQEYTTRAAASDIVSAHHNIRTGVMAALSDQSAEDCAAITARLDRKALADPYATLDYGFEPVSGGGYRPVLTVCATAQSGARNVPVARRAHDTLAAMGTMEKGAVLTDTVVSFSLRLTDGDKALCKTAAAAAATACDRPATPAPAQVAVQPANPAMNFNYGCTADNPKAVQWGLDNCKAWYQNPSNACGSGQVRVIDWPRATPPSMSSSCAAPCKDGEVRDSLRPAHCVAAPTTSQAQPSASRSQSGPPP